MEREATIMIRLAILSLVGLLVMAVSQTGEAQIFRRGCPTCRVAIIEVAPVAEAGCSSEAPSEALEGPVRRLLDRAPLRSFVKRGIDRRQARRSARRSRR